MVIEFHQLYEVESACDETHDKSLRVFPICLMEPGQDGRSYVFGGFGQWHSTGRYRGTAPKVTGLLGRKLITVSKSVD